MAEETFEILSGDDAKEVTAESMKITVQPWVEDEVEMEDLYQELELEKLENKPTGEEGTVVDSYQELLSGSSPEHSATKDQGQKQKGPLTKKGKRVLGKGEPGIGKTTLAKKITWDWATGKFTSFCVVFFVMLKLAQPGDAIESVIVAQNEWIEGMNVSEKAVRKVLEAFGGKCLLILDGFDEATEVNKEVMKIIQGRTLYTCNILVMSRPHQTKEMEKRFKTVFKVKGFTQTQAQKFATKILQDEGQVHTVLSFSPSSYLSSNKLYQCPILLSVVCVLVRDEGIDLLKGEREVGDIYLTMTQCLYKKYLLRKGWKFEQKGFLETLFSVGKIAWETLISGNPFLSKDNVVKECGEEVFAVGLLIGDEKFSSLKHLNADILVTFSHRSLQEFFGSAYFILKLDNGETIEALLGAEPEKAPFLMNPLVLEFCAYFLKTRQNDLLLAQKETVFDSLVQFVCDRIDFPQLDMYHINHQYHAINSGIKPSKTVSELLSAVFGRLTRTKELLLPYWSRPILHLFTLRREVQNNLRLLGFFGRPVFLFPEFSQFNSQSVTKDCLTVVVNHSEFSLTKSDPSILSIVQYIQQTTDRKICLRFCNPKDDIDFSCFFVLNLDEFTVHNWDNKSARFKLPSLPLCKELRKIVFRNMFAHNRASTAFLRTDLLQHTMQNLATANQMHHLPKLAHLGFEGSCTDGHLTLMFQCIWPELEHFGFGTDTSDAEMQAFVLAVKSGRFPKLQSVSLDCRSSRGLMLSFWKEKWPCLNKFAFRGESLSHAMKALETNRFPNVNTLTLNGFLVDPETNYSALRSVPLIRKLTVRHVALQPVPSFSGLLPSHLHELSTDMRSLLSGWAMEPNPNLHSLNLTCCQLTSEDFSALSRSASAGKFPVLKNLDVTYAPGDLACLFEAQGAWNHITSLRTYRETDDPSRNDFQTLCTAASQGNLRSLTELGVSSTFSDVSVPSSPELFPHVETLIARVERTAVERKAATVSYTHEYTIRSFIDEHGIRLAHVIEKGYFPALGTLKHELVDTRAIIQIRRHIPNIMVYEFWQASQ